MSSIFYYEPFYEFERFLDDRLNPNSSENQIQRRSSNNDSQSGTLAPLKPRMDLQENTETNLVTASFELPGLKKNDVNIDINNNRMTVSGESSMSSEKEEGGYAVRERRFGKFSRTLQLPQGIKDDQIKAHMDNGILTVTFPKASPQASTKKITIN